MPDLVLTDAEWAALNKVWDNWPHRSLQPLASETVTFITLALSAVPRLALASPVAGELVALVRDYDRAYCEVARDNESREAFYPGLTRHALQERLATLTGEEG